MTRSLNRTVLAGGVVYPAGTASTPDLEAEIGSEFWDQDDDARGEADEKPKARKRAAAKSEPKG